MKISLDKPTVEEYKKLRLSAEWPMPEDKAIEKAISGSELFVTAREGKDLVGMCRIFGDSGFMFLIADMIVLPEFQGKGIGKRIMEEIISYLKKSYSGYKSVTLFAAKGKEGFYENLGFKKRVPNGLGHGMLLEC